MKKIIVVSGPSNVGKTTVIRATYEKLCKDFPKHNTLLEDIRHGRELCAVIDIDGVIMGVETRGDTKEVVEESLKIFLKLKCHIILCATRTKQGTVVSVDQFVKKHGYERHLSIRKEREANPALFDAENKPVTRRIVESIKALIAQAK